MKKAICKVLTTAVALQVSISATPLFAEQTKGVAKQSINSEAQTGSREKRWNSGGWGYI